jgi:hypothetical protein
MFLGEITVVDHAYVDNTGKIIGGSFIPSFQVTGEVDPVESVVEDFSSIKKRIKALIDDKVFGFDHKLWLINGFSACSFTFADSQNNLLDTAGTYQHQVDELYAMGYDVIHLTTELGNVLTMPLNAVKIVSPSHESYRTYSTLNAGKWFEEFLIEKFQYKFKLDCNNSEEPVLPLGRAHPHKMFSYVHGLKSSTSWGCQNLAHGHLSFIQVQASRPDTEFAVNEILYHMVAELDQTVFIFDENIKKGRALSLENPLISYETERGHFDAQFNQKSFVLETETTIEFLVEYVDRWYGLKLYEAGVTKLFVSEGLSKGAFIDLSERHAAPKTVAPAAA